MECKRWSAVVWASAPVTPPLTSDGVMLPHHAGLGPTQGQTGQVDVAALVHRHGLGDVGDSRGHWVAEEKTHKESTKTTDEYLWL